jgi:TfoX/Sxy family transcriptional regulator of competence genes
MAPSKTPKMPKPTQETKDFFASLVPDHPAVSIRPMFGQLSAFVNGNMFMGIFGEDVLLRLPEADRAEVTDAGGGPFEPMPGRPMREYVVVPAAWRNEPDRIRGWAARALDHAEELPPKRPAPKRAAAKRPAPKRSTTDRARAKRSIRKDA